ncbi:MAG: GNAT family N-acetyltransferase [Clostridiales bacterium]|jgi:predicted GNAT family N-acyltransferase|nr:GNAT family N-acetyltransferase [Clostridiales bacterium]MCI1961210.1 GNAT family N-acetyltransferase [Clostridiales bacterium]MCI2021651.1 GNAT family N-acetyltransferase [Clostridiales bacterium]MCI2026437.1 GNAT family N-acetyltransferase [Clostridiales bacterium]MCI2191751.1 GNAT family N-acetyltransferase [Oscillospiraceae bacterium]
MKSIINKKLTPQGKEIRQKVFVEEQGFQKEYDEIDLTAEHLVLYDGDIPKAVGRMFREDPQKPVYTIGRVAVLKEFRGEGLGRVVVEELEQKAKKEGGTAIKLSAQCRVQKFYEKLNYHAVGDIFYDEFCPHICMTKEL